MPLINGLFTERVGRGRPMMCLHGGMGFDQTTLRPWLDPLADSCELIYFDQRGNGRSDAPDDWEKVDHASWVEDTDVLRQDLGVGKVVLFGHSWGGYLAQEYALRFPQNVAALVLCSTAPALDYGPVIVDNARVRGTDAQVDAVLSALSSPMVDNEALEAFVRTIAPLYFHNPADSNTARVFDNVQFRAAAFNRSVFHCAPTYNTLDKLSQLKMPTLLLGGVDDWIMPLNEGLHRIAGVLPHADTHVFEHSGHFPFVEEPQEFLDVMRTWLAAIPA